MGFSLEVKREIWNDEYGCRFEVGPDRDGLNLVELREIDSTGKIIARMVFPPEMCDLLTQALGDCAFEITSNMKRQVKEQV